MNLDKKIVLIKYVELEVKGRFALSFVSIIKNYFAKRSTKQGDVVMENLFIFLSPDNSDFGSESIQSIKIFFNYNSSSSYIGRLNSFYKECTRFAEKTQLSLQQLVLHHNVNEFSQQIFNCLHLKWELAYSEKLTNLALLPASALDLPLQKLTTVDCFSGVGGIAYALKSVTRVVTYCEYNEISQKVLKSNISKNFLDSAVIHGDINTLQINKSYDLLTAGFPCQGFSVQGAKQGLNHPGSNLYYAMTNVIRTSKPKYIFFENVANFAQELEKSFVLQEYNNMGYHMFWASLPASDTVGSPHTRKRWFCLGIHKSAPVDLPFIPNSFIEFDFSKEIYSRTTSQLTLEEARVRRRLLGNSVIAPAVSFAWNFLVATAQTILNAPPSSLALTFKTQNPSILWNGFCLATSPLTPHGLYSYKELLGYLTQYNLEPSFKKHYEPTESHLHWKTALILDPKYSKPLSRKQKTSVAKSLVKKDRWATPLFSDQGPDQILSTSYRKFCSEIYFEASTKDRDKPINPCYVEWMFGLPHNFTEILPSILDPGDSVDWVKYQKCLPNYKT